ncbi:MAG: HAD family hydrolase [Caldilineae bacterium]|nr:MAG: HAD family hydrolase [Caldilineae bacterium]
MTTPVRIAMWSGPRNISTALMRAWENRPDTVVHDEPFYAYYLAVTGVDHPGREEIIAAYESDWRRVVAQITRAPLPPGKTIYYQKHMTHHILDEMSLEWMDELVNCFLIREPREVITSYMKVRPDFTLADIGFAQQWRLFVHVRERTGRIPPVIDARDVLEDPRGVLTALCEAVGVPFSERMLRWPAGPRPTDGLWAKYWYAAVEASTGFAPYRPKPDQPPAHLQPVLDAAQEIYQELHRHRLKG